MALVVHAGPSAAGSPPARSTGPTVNLGDTHGRQFTLLYGDNHVFGVLPPAGWVVDDTAGLGSKIRAVLYPEGSSWRGARTVMYVNPLHQESRARRTLRQMVERDVASFIKNTPRGKVTAADPLRTGAGKTAEVRYFSHAGGAPEEAVAYVEEDGLVMLLVLSSNSPEGLRGALPAFQQLVGSYQFLAGNVQTPR